MPLKFPNPALGFSGFSRFRRENHLVVAALKPLQRKLILAIGLTTFGAALEAISVSFIAAFLQSLTSPNEAPLQTGIAWFDTVVLGTQASAMDRIIRLSALLFVTVWLRVGFSYFGKLYSKACEAGIMDGLRRRLFDQFQSLSLRYYSQSRSGEMISTITTEVERIGQGFDSVSNFVVKGLTLLAYAAAMLIISWQLTLISMMLFGLLAAVVSNMVRQVRESSFAMSTASGETTSAAMEYIGGVRTVQASATQAFEKERFSQAADRYKQATLRAMSAAVLVQPLTEAAATSVLLGIVILAIAVLVPNGTIQPISLLAFLFALFRLLPILVHLNSNLAQASSYYGSVHHIQQLLRTDNKPYMQDGQREFPGLKRAIELVAVDFSYEANKPVLQDVTLTIERGQTVALVGASGSGKSTLGDLLIRFYDPTGGTILLDGVNLHEFNLTSYRQKFAVVSQDTFVFNASVRENIAYGLPHTSDQAIAEAARQANALGFIQDMPQGFETRLGDRGVRLSGGQRQRLAIARALLRNPEILILDEATSALDSVSERLVQESLENLSAGRTVIAIAHRLSTIFNADKIVVLEQGQVVEQGSYQELLALRGKFWNYHQMQNDMTTAP